MKKLQKEQLILEHLGLSENEATLYLVMLLHPKSTVQELQQKSPFPRTMLYYVLKQLIEKNLVTVVKHRSKKSIYIVEDPKRLHHVLEQREKDFVSQKQDIRALIPELQRTYRLSSQRPGTTLFEGLDQYKTALADVFTTSADIMYMYVPKSGREKPGLEIRKQFHEKRVKKDIVLHLLVGDVNTGKTLRKLYKHDRLFHIRLVPEHVDLEDVDIRLYTDKILYTRYNDREPICLLIEDTPLYKMQRMLFKQLWDMSTKIR